MRHLKLENDAEGGQQMQCSICPSASSREELKVNFGCSNAQEITWHARTWIDMPYFYVSGHIV